MSCSGSAIDGTKMRCKSVACFIFFFMSCMLLFEVTNGQITFLDNPVFRPHFRNLRNFFFDINTRQSPNEIFRINLKNNKLQKQFNKSEPFFCDINGAGARSKEIPNSVHKLRPGDIDIVAAIGDSLTAGNGALATNILQVTLEYKGVSFSIGGEKTWREFLTIPNILKEFNPNLYGYSLSTGLSIHQSSKFNVAELGAMSRDTVHMTKVLIQRIKADRHVKPYHWKLITFLIGANDFCLDICYHQAPQDIVKMHEKDLLTVFRLLRNNLPRTMLNVVLPPDINVLLEFTGKKPECETTHHFECPCFFGFKFQKYRKTYLKVIKEWREKLIEVANRDEFNNDNFTINVQPFTKNVMFPKTSEGNTDYTYMTFDCFHLSQKGYALATTSLWNNMLQDDKHKSENWNWIDSYKFLCPTHEMPFLRTRDN